ncbi:MAG: hypothetical protein VKJ64_14260 [Leptolyngbyaceae bacterium]|nr:hypothetical protein [Leptolyngbyaceae bacterium]
MSRFWPLSLPLVSLWAIATSGVVLNPNGAIASPHSELPHSPASEPEHFWVNLPPPFPLPATTPERSPSPLASAPTAPTPVFPNVWQLATDGPIEPPTTDTFSPDGFGVEPLSAPAINAAPDPTLESVDTLTTVPETIVPETIIPNHSTTTLVSELVSEAAWETAVEAEAADPVPTVSDPDSTPDPTSTDNDAPSDRPSTDPPPNLALETTAEIDPELGILRLRPLADSEPSVIDPELGILRLRPLAPPPPRRRFVAIAGQIDFFSGNNLLARSEPEADDIFQVGLSLRAVPRLNSRTFLIGSAEISSLRYVKNDDFNYNQLELRFGVYHYLTRRMYTDLHWRNQQFFLLDGGDRFLDTHELRWAVGRIDPINPNLTLNSAYQLQMSWAEPEERSRLSNRFYLGLTQALTPDFEAGLSYQFMLNDYTHQERNSSYHQLLAQLRYEFTDTTSLTVFGGGRWGDSTNDLIDFDTALLGVSFIVNVPLF